MRNKFISHIFLGIITFSLAHFSLAGEENSLSPLAKISVKKVKEFEKAKGGNLEAERCRNIQHLRNEARGHLRSVQKEISTLASDHSARWHYNMYIHSIKYTYNLYAGQAIPNCSAYATLFDGFDGSDLGFGVLPTSGDLRDFNSFLLPYSPS
jgi:hypothetical protein